MSSACGPCKRAHLACDVARPCKRCVNMNKEDRCEDVPVSLRIRIPVNRAVSNGTAQETREAQSEQAPGHRTVYTFTTK